MNIVFLLTGLLIGVSANHRASLVEVITNAEAVSYVMAQHDVWAVRRVEGNDTLRRLTVRVPKVEEGIAHLRQISGTVSVVPRRFHPTSTATGQDMYSNLQGMEKRIMDLGSKYPNIAKVYQIGLSQEEHRPVYAVKIGTSPNENDPTLPEFVITGVHHAREWISAEVPMGLAEHLCAVFDKNERVRSILSTIELWIIPVLNPDGFAYTFEPGEDSIINDQKRYWRKNRRGGYGVDPNRNYDNLWGGGGSSGSKNDETYRGTKPFSETETTNIQNLIGQPSKNVTSMNGWLDNVLGFLSYHSYGQQMLYPFGGNYDHAPNEPFLIGLLQNMKLMIRNTTDITYTIEKSSQMYLADGDACDWFMQEHGYRPAFTIELRPDDHNCCEFELSGDQIAASVKEGIVSSVYMAEYLGQQVGVDKWDEHELQHNIVFDEDADNVVDYLQSCVHSRDCNLVTPTFYETNNRSKRLAITVETQGTSDSVRLRLSLCAQVLLHQVVFSNEQELYAEVSFVFPGQRVSPAFADAVYGNVLACAKNHPDEFRITTLKGNGGIISGNIVDNKNGAAAMSQIVTLMIVIVGIAMIIAL
jgi:carboxypeptidase T